MIISGNPTEIVRSTIPLSFHDNVRLAGSNFTDFIDSLFES